MRWHLGTLLAMPLLLVSPANGQMLRCHGDLVFEDSMARRVTLMVDPDQGSVKNPACHKYPGLSQISRAARLLRRRDHAGEGS